MINEYVSFAPHLVAILKTSVAQAAVENKHKTKVWLHPSVRASISHGSSPARWRRQQAQKGFSRRPSPQQHFPTLSRDPKGVSPVYS